MKRATALPSAHADEPQRLLARLPTVIKLTGLGRSTIYPGLPRERFRCRCAWVRARLPGAGRIWSAGRNRALLSTTDSAPSAESRAGAARRQRTLDAVRGATRLRSRAGGCSAPCPASPSGGEDGPSRGRGTEWAWVGQRSISGSGCVRCGGVLAALLRSGSRVSALPRSIPAKSRCACCCGGVYRTPGRLRA